ncbi:MAG: fumarylacetoacetate hydrolase family protein [Phycisphaerales bacterium]|nr:fumarylacetoacetate hydrolase family protein [Phycisphaerales bacterium]
MNLISYLKDGHDQLAFYHKGYLYDADDMQPQLPATMSMFLNYWDDFINIAQLVHESLLKGTYTNKKGIAVDDVQILCPVPMPNSTRDGYAFREHVANARRNRNLPMIPEFDQYPVFYFTNHNSVQGPGKVICMPDHFEKLDFELEVAIVINRQCKNVPAEDADNYIAGLMIMNDLSARTLQMEEMLLNLGPAKGKDFATAFGPTLITLDSLATFEVPCHPNHVGKSWNLNMKAFVNSVQVSAGNLKDMNWTFAELIERASYGVTLYPGDIIGSGTVGTGCFLELNGTAKSKDPNFKEQWLQAGDTIILEVDALGQLVNTIDRDENSFSIRNRKK